MSSLLNFFSSWSAPANSTVTSTEPSVPSSSSGDPSVDDAFVMIDTPAGGTGTPMAHATPTHSRTPSSTADTWSPIDAPDAAIKLPSPISVESTARSCRLYGAAHKAPRLHPSSTLTTIPEPNAVNTPNTAAAAGTKRSFAEILKSSTPTSVAPSRLAYAQSAELSVAEQMLAKIEQLEAIKNSTTNFIDANRMSDDIESALESIQYSSPPLKPTTPLTRDQMRLYDDSTAWSLNVDEPNSKRAKRTASPTTVVLTKAETQAKLAKKKGKAKPAARNETKAIDRARGDKMQATL